MNYYDLVVSIFNIKIDNDTVLIHKREHQLNYLRLY